MLTWKMVLAGLTIAGLIITGCVPHVLPGPTATARTTETAAPTATATPIPATGRGFPTIAPLPENSSPPFAGYDSGGYEDGYIRIQEWINRVWVEMGKFGAQEIGEVGGTLLPVPLEGEAGEVCLRATQGEYARQGLTMCIPRDLENGGPLALPSGDGPFDRAKYSPIALSLLQPDNRHITVGTGADEVIVEVDASGKGVRYVDSHTGQWESGEYAPPSTLSSDFLNQFTGTAYNLKDNQVLYTPDGDQASRIASVEGDKFKFMANGQEVAVDLKLAQVPEAKWFLNGTAEQVMAVNDSTGSYWQYEFDRQTGQWVEKALPEVSTNINAPTTVGWTDIVGNRWATAVRRAIDSGKIPTFGPNVIWSEMILNFESVEINGWNGPSFTLGNSKYVGDPSTRPVMPTAYAQFLNDGVSRILVTEQVAQKDGGYGLINMGDLRNGSGTLEADIAAGDISILPVTQASDRLCLKYYSNSVCEWLVNSGGTLASEAIDKWMSQGILDPVLGRVLFLYQNPRWF